MELITVVTGVVGLLLASAFWIWWKDGKRWYPFYSRLCRRIRAALGVVSRDELRVMQEYFQQREREWERRVTELEAKAKFSSKLQYVSKEMERRLTQVEQSELPHKFSDDTRLALQPRSMVRLGVRLTLSDMLWDHLGSQGVDQIEDHLIDSMIQGPFCPVCLKRVVARDHHKALAEVPAQCRHCGISWDSQGAIGFPLSLIDLKRQVYAQLDQEYRAGERMY